MISRVLLFVGGLLAAACFACTPVEVPPPPGAVACAVDNIGMLSTQFVNPTDPRFTPVASGSAPDNMVRDVKQAVSLAAPFFQTQLCHLDGIFIVPQGESWGMRNPQTGKRYIALSAALWPRGGSPLRLAAYKDAVLRRLLNGWTGPKHTPRPDDPSHDPAVTILAVLAHEFGHVLFYDKFVDPLGTAPKFDSAAFCGGKFYTQTWQPDTLPKDPIRWRKFDEIAALHLPDDVQIAQIKRAVFAPGGAGRLLSQFYSRRGTASGQPNGRWASLLAGFSPDHDFVETFELFVLINSNAPLNSLEINIPRHGKHDIVATCSTRPVLMNKLACLQQELCPKATGNVCGRVCP